MLGKRERRTTEARAWLRENGYDDIANKIDAVMHSWRLRSLKTRRNWWLVLAGGRNGKTRTVDGTEFPVLAAAQLRQGIPVTANALQRSPNEIPPETWKINRWSR